MYKQTQFNAMYKFNTFKYWFTRLSNHTWRVVDRKNTDEESRITPWTYDENINEILVDCCDDMESIISAPIDTIRSDFLKFRETRPEYWVGAPIDKSSPISNEAAITLYETLIVGVAFIRAYRNGANPDDTFNKIQPCLDWVRQGDFYTCPASSMYHESYHGGLLLHTLNVVSCIVDLHEISAFSNVPIENAILVALVHDWCKIGLYESYNRNVKNDVTGKWEKVVAYRRKDPILPLGHGVSSMYLARSYFKLSAEESLAIRWHMGEYNVAPNEMNELHKANERYPLVQLIQFADRLSIAGYSEVFHAYS